MQADAVRTPSRRRSAMLATALAAGCLIAAGLVVPGAGAAPAPLAKAGTRLPTAPPSCTSAACGRTTVQDFENLYLGQWQGFGGAAVAISTDLARSGTHSMVISGAGTAAGAAGGVSTGAKQSWVSVAVRVEPIPVSMSSTMPSPTRVTLRLEDMSGTQIDVTDDVRDGGWTTLGSWTTGSFVRLTILRSPQCGTPSPGRLFVDDVTVFAEKSSVITTKTKSTAADPAAADPEAAAGEVQRQADATTSTGTTTRTSTHTTTTIATCPTGPVRTTTTPTPTGSGVIGFEDGSTDGWAPLNRGQLTVRAASARSGSWGLQVSRINAGNRNGAQLTAALDTIPGSGDWVRAAVWVRAAKAAKTGPLEPGRLYLIRGDGSQANAPVTVRTGAWVQLVAYLPVSQDATTVTVGLRQWPKLACAAGQTAIGQVDLDDVTLERVATPTTPTPTATFDHVEPQCGVTKR